MQLAVPVVCWELHTGRKGIDEIPRIVRLNHRLVYRAGFGKQVQKRVL